MRKVTVSTVCALALASSLFVGCGSSSSSNNDNSSGKPTSGTLVDPYIIGAVMYQDDNNNSKYDSGELISTKTDANGKFTFSKELTAGKLIRIKTQGLHEGVTFDLDLAGIVDSDKKISVVSTMSTLNARGLSTAQIAEILNKAAADANVNGWSITADKILTDPLSGGLMSKKVGEITDAELVAIQASIVTYGIIKIMNGSTTLAALSNNELYTSGKTSGGELNKIATGIISVVTDTVSKSFLTAVKTSITAGQNAIGTGLSASPFYDATTGLAKAKAGLPEPAIEVVIKTAVITMDRIATLGYETCNATSGSDSVKVDTAIQTVANHIGAITASASNLGEQLYAMTYANSLATFEDVGGGTNIITSLPANLQTGYNDQKSGKKTYRFDANDALVAK